MISTARTESDSFGPIDVLGDAYWEAQTQRSIQNRPFGRRETMSVEIARALAFDQAGVRTHSRGTAVVNFKVRLMKLVS